jgi:two-component system chemotaxis sensor kinase CheA
MNSDDDILATAMEGFQQEAQEMLQQFEAGLLAIEDNPADTEALNSAFRAAHTIKGGAGLFGFEAVVHFTHEVESVMESMRSGELQLDEKGFALLLHSQDQLAGLLGELGSATPDPVLAQKGSELAEQLRALRGAGLSTAATPDKAATATAVTGAPQGVWHISLQLGADALRNGLDPMSFIRYLDKIGEVLQVRTVSEQLPSLDHIDPESCYLGFEIRLSSQSKQQDIEQIFDFLREDCAIDVLPPEATAADFAALLARREAYGASPAQCDALDVLWKAMGVVQAPVAEVASTAPPDTTAAPVSTEDRREAKTERRGEEARFIRVRADKLDKLIDMIGELVIASSGAQLAAQQGETAHFSEAALRIHDLVEQARDGALGLRMVPIGETFTRFQRVIRDVSKQLGKEVDLQITGGDTELDKSMVETIADPLMHLVRNSLDHGLEGPEERVAAGKSRQGRLALHAYHEAGGIYIEVSDDGRGLNRDRILSKAIERGLVEAGTVLDDAAVHQLIFMPGFSTAEQVTNLSGRGVGMDVVKRNVEALRGSIQVASQPGQGATMQIRLPLTLAIIDGFLTQVGGVSYVLPLELVAECLEVPAECGQTDRVCGHFDLRGEVMPYLDLSRFYHHAPSKSGRRSVVLVRDGRQRVGLLVDRLLGEHQTVIKPLGAVFQHIQGLGGSTILGSGEVALILDVPALLRLASSQLSPLSRRSAMH